MKPRCKRPRGLFNRIYFNSSVKTYFRVGNFRTAAAWTVLLILVWPSIGLCLTGAEAVRLTKAGVGKKLMAAIVRERIVETAAMTVDEIIELKKAGIGDAACIALVENLSFLKGPRRLVYGKDVRPIRMATVGDLIDLKQEGLSDAVLTAVVQAQSSRTKDDEREAAMAVLRSVGIWVNHPSTKK